MINKPIYEPQGRAREYGSLACNIYTGCNHGCKYCYAPKALRIDRAKFHAHVEPRRDIVESVKRQLERKQLTDKLIFLCFSCDPYPAEIDTTATRETIKAIKGAGNHVQILTKGGRRAERDFDLLDGKDWFGVTIAGDWTTSRYEPKAAVAGERLQSLADAKEAGIQTWVSCEPVLYPEAIYGLIADKGFIDFYQIGKLNYHKPEQYGERPIDWCAFGRMAEMFCVVHGRNYNIKDDLRRDMEGKSL
jgi:DNA repair photolyase